MVYEYVSDVLRAMKIDPEDVLLIRHAPAHTPFRRAYRAGFLKEYTSMQEDGFAEGKTHLMVFIGERKQSARFYALYRIAGHRPTRRDYIPEDYPNKDELDKAGGCFYLREKNLPQGLSGFVADWGGNVRQWAQPATREKPITEITSQNTKTGGARE